MTRHKDSAALYADAETFKNFSELSSTLSRERLKRSTLDVRRVARPEKPKEAIDKPAAVARSAKA